MKKLVFILLVALFLLVVARHQVEAAGPWPGVVDLWASANITTTTQYRAQDVVGADTLHLFYKFGPATGTGVITMTISGLWRGVTGYSTIVTSTTGVGVTSNGVVTVTSIYPTLGVNLLAAGTTSATVTVAGRP